MHGSARENEQMPSHRFVYPSERRLQLMVGRVNAVAGFAELSIRRFLHESKEPANPVTQLKALSDCYGVSVSHVDCGLLKLRTNQLHLVSIDQVFEDFLRAFSKEHPALSGLEDRTNAETLLKYFLSDVVSTAEFDETENLQRDLVEHYHSVRNRFAHASRKKSPDVTVLQERTKAILVLSKREAPHTYREITYDDVVAFAWSVLGLARALCARSQPTPSEIAKMVLALDGEPDSGVKLRDYKSREPDRRRHGLQGLLSTLYSLDAESADSVIRELDMGC